MSGYPNYQHNTRPPMGRQPMPRMMAPGAQPAQPMQGRPMQGSPRQNVPLRQGHPTLQPMNHRPMQPGPPMQMGAPMGQMRPMGNMANMAPKGYPLQQLQRPPMSPLSPEGPRTLAPGGPRQMSSGVGQFQPSHQPANSIDLARQYERDIHQIEKYLFRERDDSGRRLEKYVAHVRVIEDSRSPSRRPPENSASSNKKFRFLILTVKISGRMRLHKAKENPDGLIQIGRTWDFDQLSKMELDEEVPTGFLFSMGKHYYWKTRSAKERTVWLSTVLEQYIRYTNGGTPSLVNCSVDLFHLGGLMREVKGPQGTNTDTRSPSIAGTGTMSTHSVPSGVPSSHSVPSSVPSNHHVKSQASSVPVTTPATSVPSNKKSLSSFHFSHSRHASSSSLHSEESKHRHGVLGSFRRKSSKKKEKVEEELREKAQREEAELHRQEELRKRVIEEKERQMRIERERLEAAAREKQRELDLQKQMQKTKQQQQMEQLKQGDKAASLSSVGQDKDSLERQKSTVSSVSFVSSRRSPTDDNQLDEESALYGEGDADGDYIGDYTEDYEDSLEDVASAEPTAPLRLSMQPPPPKQDVIDNRSIDSSLDNTNDKYQSVDDASQLPDELKQIFSPVPGVTADDSDISSELSTPDRVTDSMVQPTGGKLELARAPSRAFSRVSDEEKKAGDFTDLFDEIGYDPVADDYDSLEAKLKKQLERLQMEKIAALTQISGAGTSLSGSVQEAFSQCEKIDSGLSVFGVQLSGFKDNVNYIEKQGQGLQIETTNKKLLKKQLNEILYSVDLSSDKLRALLNSHVTLSSDFPTLEKALSELYSSLDKMKGSPGGAGSASNQLANMKALQEKRSRLDRVMQTFVANFKKDAKKVFQSVCASLTTKMQSISYDKFMQTYFRDVLVERLASLLPLSGMLAFVKQVSPEDYNQILVEFTQVFRDYFDHLSALFLRQFDNQFRKLLFPKFDFNGAPKDFIDRSCLRTKQTTTNARNRRPGGNNILEELGLSPATESPDFEETAETESDDLVVHKLLRCVVENVLNVMTLLQELTTKLFSLSSATDDPFQAVIKTPVDERVSHFTLLDNYVSGNVETDRDVSDSIFEIMKSLFTETTNNMFKVMLSVSKQNMLQSPSVLLLLQSLAQSLASSNQEYLYGRFTALESRVSTLWDRQREEQVQAIISAPVSCRVMSFTKAYTVYYRKLEHNLALFKIDDADKLPVHDKLVASSNDFWKVIKEALAKAEVPGEEVVKHLALLLNYKWVVDQAKDASVITSAIKTEADELRSKEMSVFTDDVCQTHEIGELMRFMDGVDGLVKSSTDPSKTKSYSTENLQKLLDKFKGNDLKESIKRLAADLQGEVFGRCYDGETSGRENKYSLSLGREVEKDLYNNCMSSLSIAYTSTFTKLNPILKQYYHGVVSPVDKTVISFNFNKESMR